LPFFRRVNRRRLAIAGAVALALGVAIGVWAYNENQPIEKRGSAKEEFVTTPEPQPKPRRASRVPWPTYGYDIQRRHISPFGHRPPYRRLWRIDAGDTVEFPPSVGHGLVFVPQQRGKFFAVDARTGKTRWRKDTNRCAAASPTIHGGTVYQAYMDFDPCPQARPGATGFVVAWDARTGRRKWVFRAAPVESSPLYRKKTLYFGAWDRRVYAVNARTGKTKWSYETDEEVNTSPTAWRGTIYIANDAGNLYALRARDGKLVWKSGSNSRFGSREFFYATPTLAYGRVYIGNTDGTMYVYGAKTGKLRWARPLGSYIYGAAAVWRRTVYVGTYDGAMYALDAATGDVKWKVDARGAVHSAPTIMRGLVYYSVCSTCGSAAQRAVARGPDATYALDARSGRRVWKFGSGKYANPVIADSKRIYLTGQRRVYALKPRGARRKSRR
jgi:outer membrane protein assembly factor BamB